MKIFDSIPDGIEYFLITHAETKIELSSGYGVWLHDFETAAFSGLIFKVKERDTRLDFYPKDSGCIFIEQIKVNESKQRCGIGSQLFSLLLYVIREFNGKGYEIGGRKIDKICGELCPYEYPLDQYDKSVPFYQNIAKKFDIRLQLYRKDENYKLNIVPTDEYDKFIMDEPEGHFEFCFK